MISGVKPRASGRNNVGQQLLAFLLFRDRWSVAQQCWRRLHSSYNIVGAMHAPIWLPNSSFQSRISCILPTMHCRTPNCWESLRLFVHYCQHGRNNSQHCWANNVGSCCLRLHVAQEYWKKIGPWRKRNENFLKFVPKSPQRNEFACLMLWEKAIIFSISKKSSLSNKDHRQKLLVKMGFTFMKTFSVGLVVLYVYFFFNFKWIVI